jgi:hypothetical protein
MSYQTLKGHFDGEKVCIDEPVNLSPNTNLLITVLPNMNDDESWSSISMQGLTEAYGVNEPEYGLDKIKVSNPDFKK